MAFERRPEPEIKVAPAIPRPSTPAPGTKPPPAAQSLQPQRLEPKPPAARKPPATLGDMARGERLVSLDAFRGAIMLLLASGAFHMSEVLKNVEAAGYTSDDRSHRIVSFFNLQFSHVPWQ